MNTKKAIEYLRLCKLEDIGCNYGEYDDITKLLERGEKFEKIWKRLKRDNKTVTFYDEMEALEQKYFPK